MKQVQKNSFISYVLSDQVRWCNIKQFLSYSKNYVCKFMQAKLWHHKFSTLVCLFQSRKCGKEGKKLQKFEYLENEKSFLHEIKNIFHSFWKPVIWWKNKNLIKNSEHKLSLFFLYFAWGICLKARKSSHRNTWVGIESQNS